MTTVDSDCESIDIVHINELDCESVTGSVYSQVVFTEIQDIYEIGQNIQCQYRITEHLTIHPNDYLGLYKVGWTSARDYITYMWAPLPQDYVPGSSFTQTVVFYSKYLPSQKQTGEDFFQFCYVTANSEVRGASLPFQFKSLDSLSFASNPLVNNIARLESKLEKDNEKIKKLEDTLHNEELTSEYLNDKLRISESKLEDLKNEFVLKQQSFNSEQMRLQEELSLYQKETCELRKKLGDNEDLIPHLRKKIEELSESVEVLENKNLCLSREKFDMEESISERLMNDFTHKISELNHQLENSNNLILKKEIEFNADFNKLKNEKAELINELNNLKEVLDEKSGYFDQEKLSFCQQNELLTSKISLLEAENKKLKRDNTNMTGSSFALKTAHNHLKTKYDSLKLEHSQLKCETSNTEPKKTKDEATIEDLKMRLHLAKQTYTEKAQECLVLQRELQSLKLQHANPVTSMSDGCEDSIYNKMVKISSDLDASTINSSTNNSNEREVNALREQLIEVHKKNDDFLVQIHKYKALIADQEDSSQKDKLLINELKLSANMLRKICDHKYQWQIDDYCVFKHNNSVGIVTRVIDNNQCQIIELENRDLVTISTSDIKAFDSKILCLQRMKDVLAQLRTPAPSYDNSSVDSMRACHVCNATFAAECTPRDFDDHMSSHYGPKCPICSKQFPENFPVEQFELHVTDHLD